MAKTMTKFTNQALHHQVSLDIKGSIRRPARAVLRNFYASHAKSAVARMAVITLPVAIAVVPLQRRRVWRCRPCTACCGAARVITCSDGGYTNYSLQRLAPSTRASCCYFSTKLLFFEVMINEVLSQCASFKTSTVTGAGAVATQA